MTLLSHKNTTMIPVGIYLGVLMVVSRNLFGIKSFLPIFDAHDALFEQIFINSPTALSVTDAKGIIQYVNQAFIDLTGYTSKELIGQNHSLMKSSKNDSNFFQYFWDKLLKENIFNGNIWNRHRDAEDALHAITIVPIALDTLYYLSTHVDITKEAVLQKRQCQLAYHDPHTGLANRSLFEDRLSHAIDNAVRIGNSVGILYCGLNEFKHINDEFGHTTGDYVLAEVAKRFQSYFRTNDTVARFGGDEFVIIIEHLKDNTQLLKIAEELKKKIKAPIGDLNLSVSTSIGIACFPQDGLTKDQLLMIANDKMYHNKNQYYGLVS